MANKDMVERDVVREEHPQVELLICLFHTLKVLRSQFTFAKHKIAEDKRQALLKHVQAVAYSSSEAKYQQRYTELKQCSGAESSAITYFNTYWNPICSQWKVRLFARRFFLQAYPSSDENERFTPITASFEVVAEVHNTHSVPASLDASNVSLSGVNLPHAIKRRGRPASSDLTVIGLPSKRDALRSTPLMPQPTLCSHLCLASPQDLSLENVDPFSDSLAIKRRSLSLQDANFAVTSEPVEPSDVIEVLADCTTNCNRFFSW
ncbi:hypothetical protein CAPTEDRAFT_201210 [Capitella teleta]|uniref:Uncharacterized protein n=1 Tax=Capitella teleta TaxID=283909 RepID=R7U4J9_CAPTE|nr:hypothetical protein CAPTEDRAFT_201210 [Capitella teleta]|eukprot:ELU01290.1 hypothetical protein CAPTEDRAFT_201210 [Capitella teleta]